MLQCRDRTFYVGHTDDLELRVAQHQQGTFGGYTAQKRPVTLVWSAEFPTRYEALEAERRIKGWRREKKLALIRGDWGLISQLSRGRKGRPSTSSGRTGSGESAIPSNTENPRSAAGASSSARPELIEGRSFYLFRHPEIMSPSVTSIQAVWQRRGRCARLRFVVRGDIRGLAIPDATRAERTDELWRTTCFELFLRRPDGGYWEFNFAPSAQWAAYRFADYRQAMADLAIARPHIAARQTRSQLRIDIELDLPDAANPVALNLAAVIEEKSGTKSYWALAHPPEGRPDFHHPSCFVLELASPNDPPSPRT